MMRATSILMVATCCAISGCRESAAPVVPDPVTVRLGLAPEICWLPLIAKHLGYFAEEGVHIELTTFARGNRSMTEGFAIGDVDVACVGSVSVAAAVLQRSNLRVLATIGTHYDLYRVLANTERGINSPGDLVGKHIAVQESGSDMHYFLYNMLLREGIAEEDTHPVEMKVEDQGAALAQGEVDAIVSREPYLSEAARLLGQRAKLMSSPNLPSLSVNLIANGEFVKNQPDAVRRVLRALIRADQFVLDNPDKAMHMIAEELDQPVDDVIGVWDQTVLEVTLEQSLFVELENILRWAHRHTLPIDGGEIPSIAPFVYQKALKDVAPESVTVF